MRSRFVGLLVAIFVAGACTTGATPSPASPSSPPTQSPSAPSSPSAPTPTPAITPSPAVSPAGTPTPRPTPTPTVIPSPAPASLPVTADARDIATEVRMAPRPDGGLFVSVPATGGTVLASLDDVGAVRAGWPLMLAGAERCYIEADPADGSVHAVCGVGEAATRAYAFDAAARPLAGWPVDLRGTPADQWQGDPIRLVGGDLYVALAVGEPTATMLVRVSRNGSVEESPRVEFTGSDAVIGPDGTAYLRSIDGRDPAGTSTYEWITTISALTLDGPKAGFPVSIDGLASLPVFAGPDRLYLVTRVDDASGSFGTPQVIGLTNDGRGIDGWPRTVRVWGGAGPMDGGPGPAAPPVVGPDGSVYVVGSSGSAKTAALALDPTGRPRAGWPYESGARLANVPGWSGCIGCEPGCGYFKTWPIVARDGRLVVVEGLGDDSGGDRIVAVGTGGKVEAGWPVYLAQKGAWFAGMAVGDDGVVYGYAIEPARTGPNDCTVYSGTIVALDATGARLWATTVVLP